MREGGGREDHISTQTLLKEKHWKASKELLGNLTNEIDLRDEKTEWASNMEVYPNIKINQSFLKKKNVKEDWSWTLR